MAESVRVLLGKIGLDGHDRGIRMVAAWLRDGGTEVIYVGTHQTAEKIARAASDEDADVIGLSFQGADHGEDFCNPVLQGVLHGRNERLDPTYPTRVENAHRSLLAILLAGKFRPKDFGDQSVQRRKDVVKVQHQIEPMRVCQDREEHLVQALDCLPELQRETRGPLPVVQILHVQRQLVLRWLGAVFQLLFLRLLYLTFPEQPQIPLRHSVRPCQFALLFLRVFWIPPLKQCHPNHARICH